MSQIIPKKTLTDLRFKALGTDIYIAVPVGNPQEEKKARQSLALAKEIYQKQQRIFCRFSPESELSRLNRKLGIFQKAPEEIICLAQRALFYHALSGGLYDPRVIGILEKIGYDRSFRTRGFAGKKVEVDKLEKISGELKNDLAVKKDQIYFGRRMDFSGIAKGFITDRVALFLRNAGWKNFLVDSGGDMYAAGTNDEGKKWKIALEGIPEKKLMLGLSENGIATSGISRKKWEAGGKKYHHLINPRDPNKFSFDVRTVTVIEKNTENADGRAKVLVLMGKEAGLEFAKKNRIAAIFLDYKGGVYMSSEAKKYIL